jgi:hypothetical protein
MAQLHKHLALCESERLEVVRLVGAGVEAEVVAQSRLDLGRARALGACGPLRTEQLCGRALDP